MQWLFYLSYSHDLVFKQYIFANLRISIIIEQLKTNQYA